MIYIVYNDYYNIYAYDYSDNHVVYSCVSVEGHTIVMLYVRLLVRGGMFTFIIDYE